MFLERRATESTLLVQIPISSWINFLWFISGYFDGVLAALSLTIRILEELTLPDSISGSGVSLSIEFGNVEC